MRNDHVIVLFLAFIHDVKYDLESRGEEKIVEGNREAELDVVGVSHAYLGFLAEVRRPVWVANHNNRS